jgi:hypothetical protein
MRLVSSQKSAAFDLSVEGHSTTRGMFSLILSPAGLQIAVSYLAEYTPFHDEANRAKVVKDIKALGLSFRTDPRDPANSWPTVPLNALTAEGVLGKFGDYLVSVVNRAKSSAQGMS